MNEAEIRRKRTESVLLELIPEALGSLNDKRLHQINVIEAKCSRGRSDVKIYLDPSSYSDKEKKEFLSLISKARPIIETYCMRDQGWFRSQKLTFEFDEQLKKSQDIEELFKKIAKDTK